MCPYVGSELSFLKLGSVLAGLTGGCQSFLESKHNQIAVSEIAVPLDWN